MKPTLLFLCHRIPFPPNKGDKIRSYHLLKYLCKHYQVFLGAFIDDENDWQYVPTIQRMCEDSCFIKLNPLKARIKSLTGLLNGRALSLPYYSSKPLKTWVRGVLEQQTIERAVVYSSPLAQYITGSQYDSIKRVIDFVDIDSDKWRQYASHKSWPWSWVYRREARELLVTEQEIAHEFDSSLFVSSAEANLFREMAPGVDQKIGFYNNGVDSNYFSPETELKTPYSVSEQVLVFTGAMDYWPNIDAVIWFAKNIFPALLKDYPQVHFYIVGSNPSDTVKQLGQLPGITVTGRVEDIRPYLKYAKVAVAPMRIARGIQNKVLEAMAMEKPTIVTPQGLEGITAEHGKHLLIADTEAEITDVVRQVLEGRYKEIGKQARHKVMSNFNWDENLPLIGQLLESTSPPQETKLVECG